MRVNSVIFVSESPREGLQGRGTASGQEDLQAADQIVPKTFISLYSGQINTSSNGKGRVANRAEARFAVRFEIRLIAQATEL